MSPGLLSRTTHSPLEVLRSRSLSIMKCSHSLYKEICSPVEEKESKSFHRKCVEQHLFSAGISLTAYIVLQILLGIVEETSVIIQVLKAIYYEPFNLCPLCTNKLAVLTASKHVRNVSGFYDISYSKLCPVADGFFLKVTY